MICLNCISSRVHKHINLFILIPLLLWNKEDKTYFCSPNQAELLPFSPIGSGVSKEVQELPLQMYSFPTAP